MRTVTDRRAVLRSGLGLVLVGAGPALASGSAWAAARADEGRTLAATWQAPEGGYRAGWLRFEAGVLLERASIELPTRAHGLARAPDGGLLVVSRRPGDWLMHWARPGEAPRWIWAEERSYNGHVLVAPDGSGFYTTESDLLSGESFVVRHAWPSLEMQEAWPTGGIDAHELIADRQDGRPALLVANGGVPTRPETGRQRVGLEHMDSSLVRLDAQDGRRLGQWRLDDPRLSLRHLARGADASVGIALQAEHDDPAVRRASPIFARFDGHALLLQREAATRPQDPPATGGRSGGRPAASSMEGYGGSIVPLGDGYLVSCPRAGGLARFRVDGGWGGFVSLPEACALDAQGDRWWAGGEPRAQAPQGPVDAGGRRIDNHWIGWAGEIGS